MCPLYYEDVTKTIWKCRKKKIQGFLLNFDSLPWRCPESFLFYSLKEKNSFYSVIWKTRNKQASNQHCVKSFSHQSYKGRRLFVSEKWQTFTVQANKGRGIRYNPSFSTGYTADYRSLLLPLEKNAALEKLDFAIFSCFFRTESL